MMQKNVLANAQTMVDETQWEALQPGRVLQEDRSRLLYAYCAVLSLQGVVFFLLPAGFLVLASGPGSSREEEDRGSGRTHA